MIYQPASIFKDSEVAEEFSRVSLAFESLASVPRILVLAKAPVKPFDGQVAICDGTNWNPLADAVKRPIWYDATAELWKKFD